MAEKATHQEDQQAEAAEAPVEKPPVYYVLNTVRRQGTRLHRARSTTRHRFKLFIGARRLLRNKKMSLTKAEFEKHQEQIWQMVLDGQVALFLPSGIRVTSLPDGRLVYTKPNGAVKIDEEPQPRQAPPPPSDEVDPAQPDDPPTDDGDDGGDDDQEPDGDDDQEPEGDEDDTDLGEGEVGDTEVDPAQPDDMTALSGIGPGRARKLAEAGIESYAQLVERGPTEVSSLLGVTEDQGAQFCSAAAELMGGSDGEG